MSLHTIQELEAHFQLTVKNHGARIVSGIVAGTIDHEHGIPFFEVWGGDINIHNAVAFCRELATTMGCRIGIAQVGLNWVTGYFDLDDIKKNPDGTLPALPEHMHDYLKTLANFDL